MKNKQRFLYDKSGVGAPEFYNAFSWMDGPIVYMFLQAHLELLRRLVAYLKGRE